MIHARLLCSIMKIIHLEIPYDISAWRSEYIYKICLMWYFISRTLRSKFHFFWKSLWLVKFQCATVNVSQTSANIIILLYCIEIHWQGHKCKCHIWKPPEITLVTINHSVSLGFTDARLWCFIAETHCEYRCALSF